jgi:hypothetical protein
MRRGQIAVTGEATSFVLTIQGSARQRSVPGLTPLGWLLAAAALGAASSLEAVLRIDGGSSVL